MMITIMMFLGVHEHMQQGKWQNICVYIYCCILNWINLYNVNVYLYLCLLFIFIFTRSSRRYFLLESPNYYSLILVMSSLPSVIVG